MAGIIGTATTDEVALVAATAKTVVWIAAALNDRVKVKEWGVFFDGISVTAEPVQVELVKSTAGSAGTLTPVERTSSALTLQTTAGSGALTEPTTTSIIAKREVHPQSGYQEKFSFGDEPTIQNGGKIGIRCTAPAIVNVRGEIVFEE